MNNDTTIARRDTPAKTGRPTARTPETVTRLEHALGLGATVADACFHAGIGQSTYHRWAADDEAFRERMQAIRRRPVLKALTTVNEALETDVKVAQWYLERRHEDFRPRQSVEQETRLHHHNYDEKAARELVAELLGVESKPEAR